MRVFFLGRMYFHTLLYIQHNQYASQASTSAALLAVLIASILKSAFTPSSSSRTVKGSTSAPKRRGASKSLRRGGWRRFSILINITPTQACTGGPITKFLSTRQEIIGGPTCRHLLFRLYSQSLRVGILLIKSISYIYWHIRPAGKSSSMATDVVSGKGRPGDSSSFQNQMILTTVSS